MPTAPFDSIVGLYRTSLTAYVQRAFTELRPVVPYHIGHHVRAICYKLEQVERGEILRLILLMPPRHLKSHCASVVFPAWVLGREPACRIICMSYGQDLAEGFSRDSRRLIEADWNRTVFPKLKLDPRRASAAELRTTANGYRMATSAGGPLTGKGADILILDDPTKAEDVASEARRAAVFDWFTGTVMTRLDNPKTGAVVLVAQRLHEDDLPGRLIATGDWEVLELPAIETQHRLIPLGPDSNWRRKPGQALLPAHMDLADFEAKRREMGSRAFEAQYQQAPTPAGGNIVRTEWFGTIPHGMRRQVYEGVVQSWDTAAVPGESNDYSVCSTWGLIGNYIDLLDIHRQKHLYPELRQAALKLRQTWKPDLIIVEAIGVGLSLYEDVRRQDPKGVGRITPRTGKVERMSVQSAKIEAGYVRLPQNAPYKEAFLAEVAAFPNGKHDDQVDSMSQALYALDFRLAELRHCSRIKGLGLGRVIGT
jgi:predicted phage terminase large subunit-like protein